MNDSFNCCCLQAYQRYKYNCVEKISAYFEVVRRPNTLIKAIPDRDDQCITCLFLYPTHTHKHVYKCRCNTHTHLSVCGPISKLFLKSLVCSHLPPPIQSPLIDLCEKQHNVPEQERSAHICARRNGSLRVRQYERVGKGRSTEGTLLVFLLCKSVEFTSFYLYHTL